MKNKSKERNRITKRPRYELSIDRERSSSGSSYKLGRREKVQNKPNKVGGRGKLKVTVSNNNEEDTTRTDSRKTTEKVENPKAKRGDKAADDTEPDRDESDDSIETRVKILKRVRKRYKM